ncbi:MAG: hypothetical protein QM820_25775 [Minicystis sp.]
MSKRRQEEQEAGELPASVFESGVVPVGTADDPDRVPPWSVVHAYLTSGAHRAWVEGHAARSPAFADVLEALRNDHEERIAPRRRGVVPLKRSKG